MKNRCPWQDPQQAGGQGRMNGDQPLFVYGWSSGERICSRATLDELESLQPDQFDFFCAPELCRAHVRAPNGKPIDRFESVKGLYPVRLKVLLALHMYSGYPVTAAKAAHLTDEPLYFSSVHAYPKSINVWRRVLQDDWRQPRFIATRSGIQTAYAWIGDRSYLWCFPDPPKMLMQFVKPS